MEKIRLSRAIVISGAVAFVAFLVLAGLLVYEYISVPKGGTEPVSIVSVPASWTLSDEQIKEAVQIGGSLQPDAMASLVKNTTQYTDGEPKSELIIFTPYYAILANAQFAKTRNQDYSLAQAREDAKKLSGAFAIHAKVYGTSDDFCKYLSAKLILSGGVVVYPIGSDVPSMAYISPSWPDYPAYEASCSWVFDASRINRNEDVLFVLTRAEGEQKAVIDLSKYK